MVNTGVTYVNNGVLNGLGKKCEWLNTFGFVSRFNAMTPVQFISDKVY